MNSMESMLIYSLNIKLKVEFEEILKNDVRRFGTSLNFFSLLWTLSKNLFAEILVNANV